MSRLRLFVPALLMVSVSLLGFSCGPRQYNGPGQIFITSPGKTVETFEFDLRFETVGEFVPGTLKAKLNKVDVLAQFEIVEPRESISLDAAEPFDCTRAVVRHPRETKGLDYDATTETTEPCCDTDGCC